MTGNGDRSPDCVTDPFTSGTEVGPKPLAYSTTVSPGCAGVEAPGKRAAGPIRLPSTWVAMTYGPPLKTKNDGESGFAVTGNKLLIRSFRVACTVTVPVKVSGGVRMFT